MAAEGLFAAVTIGRSATGVAWRPLATSVDAQKRKAIDAARLVVGFVESRLSRMLGEQVGAERSPNFIQPTGLELP